MSSEGIRQIGQQPVFEVRLEAEVLAEFVLRELQS
jgi:hypothetical protein